MDKARGTNDKAAFRNIHRRIRRDGPAHLTLDLLPPTDGRFGQCTKPHIKYECETRRAWGVVVHAMRPKDILLL